MQNEGNTELDAFIDGLIKESGYEGLTDEARAQIAGEMKELLINKINEAILNELPEEALDDLTAKMEGGDDFAKTLQETVARYNIDTTKVVTETLIRFKMFYLGGKN